MFNPKSLYDLVLDKIKLLEYPEEVYLRNVCGKKLTNEMIEYFKNSKYTMFKKYRYKRDTENEFNEFGIYHFSYINLSYLKDNLVKKKVKLKSLKSLCFDKLYSENANCLPYMRKHIPGLILKDIFKNIKYRNRVFNDEEDLNYISIERFTNKKDIESKKIQYREFVDINIPCNDFISKLKIKKQLILKILCKIKRVENDYIVIYTPKLSLIRYLENFIESNYLGENKLESCLRDNMVKIYDYKNLINELPGFTEMGNRCLDKNITYYVYSTIDLKNYYNYFKFKLYLHYIKETEYYL